MLPACIEAFKNDGYTSQNARSKKEPEMAKITVSYINHEGNGFATEEKIDAGTDLSTYFRSKMPGKSAGNFLIRVNERPRAAGYVLTEGDVVSLTPTKVQGAQRRYCIAA